MEVPVLRNGYLGISILSMLLRFSDWNWKLSVWNCVWVFFPCHCVVCAEICGSSYLFGIFTLFLLKRWLMKTNAISESRLHISQKQTRGIQKSKVKNGFPPEAKTYCCIRSVLIQTLWRSYTCWCNVSHL